MPLEIEVDTTRGLVVTRWSGRIDDRDVIAADDAFRGHPTLKPEYDQLMDVRHATIGDVTRAGIQAIMSRPPLFNRESRRAIVVPGDLGFGLARMYEQMRGGEAGEIRTFRTLAEAEAWLEAGRGETER